MIPPLLPHYAHWVDYIQVVWKNNQKFEKIGVGCNQKFEKIGGWSSCEYHGAPRGDRPQCSMAPVHCSDRLCAVQQEAMI